MENWQSEYLQFLVYVMLTIWLVQKGSPESKALDEVGRGVVHLESRRSRRGMAVRLHRRREGRPIDLRGLSELEAGVLDELQIHQIPVLLGAGRRLFEELPSRVELEIARVIDTPEATHIRYRVRR